MTVRDPVIEILESAVSDLEFEMLDLEAQRARAKEIYDRADHDFKQAEGKRYAIMRTIAKMSA